jgi:hypothetical protein
MKFVFNAILLSLLSVSLSGCGATEESQKDAASLPEQSRQRVSLSQVEKSFNPSDFDDELEVVLKQHDLEQVREAENMREDSVVVESEFTQGYRIQIFATASIDEANAMRLTAAPRITEDSLYVVFDPPVYKVRIGDFRTKAEANQKLGAVIGMGFVDAWVVGDKITLRKIVHVPSTDTRR